MAVHDAAHKSALKSAHAPTSHHQAPLVSHPAHMSVPNVQLSEAFGGPPEGPSEAHVGLSETLATSHRLKADVVSVAAPSHKAPTGLLQRTEQAYHARHGSRTDATLFPEALPSPDQSSAAALPATATVEPRAVLKTQLQQLRNLSDLLSQRLQLGDAGSKDELDIHESTDAGATSGDAHHRHAVAAPAGIASTAAPMPASAEHKADAESTAKTAEAADTHYSRSTSGPYAAAQQKAPNAEEASDPASMSDLLPMQQPAFTVRTVLVEPPLERGPFRDKEHQQGDLGLQMWGAASDDEGSEAG